MHLANSLGMEPSFAYYGVSRCAPAKSAGRLLRILTALFIGAFCLVGLAFAALIAASYLLD